MEAFSAGGEIWGRRSKEKEALAFIPIWDDRLAHGHTPRGRACMSAAVLCGPVFNLTHSAVVLCGVVLKFTHTHMRLADALC